MHTGDTSETLWSDAWLMLAIAIADNGNGATLQSIIAAGDFINHAIFTGSEIRHGLAIFTHLGYIQAIDDRFLLTGNAKDFWATKHQARISVNKLMSEFNEFLRAVFSPGAPLADDNKWQYPSITDEMVNQAYQSYIGESRARKKKPKNKSVMP
jgi:hypothetical protein